MNLELATVESDKITRFYRNTEKVWLHILAIKEKFLISMLHRHYFPFTVLTKSRHDSQVEGGWRLWVSYKATLTNFSQYDLKF